MRDALRLLYVVVLFAAALLGGNILRAAEGETAVERDYSRVTAPPAPVTQTEDQVAAKSDGCYSCHLRTDAPSMHETPAVRLGCTDCHGGDATVRGNSDLPHDHPDYIAAREAAHDHDAGGGELPRELTGDLGAVRRADAGADDRHRGLRQDLRRPTAEM